MESEKILVVSTFLVLRLLGGCSVCVVVVVVVVVGQVKHAQL